MGPLRLLSLLLLVIPACLAQHCSTQSTATLRTVGYYEESSIRRACDAVYPESITISGYTHVNYAHAYIDPSTFELAPILYDDTDGYVRLTQLKALNPGLQVWLSIGGWAMNNPDQPTAKTFSQMVSSPGNLKTFSTSLVSMMQTYGFDGVDLDWQYPGVPERGGSADDYVNYATFVHDLRNELTATGFTYGLSVTIPQDPDLLQHYDFVKLSGDIDWFNVMPNAIFNNETKTTPHSDMTKISKTLGMMFGAHVDPAKVTLGLSFYGKSFNVTIPGCDTIGCDASSPGNMGLCSGFSGLLSYDEILAILQHGHPTTYDSQTDVNIMTFGENQWVSYEDSKTLANKVKFANVECLGGTAVWASTADRTGTAIRALGSATGQFQRAAARPNLADATTQCQWTGCFSLKNVCVGGGGKSNTCVPSCPAGTSQAWGAAGKQTCGDDGSSVRLFCCPNNARTTCEVANSTRPICQGRCNGDQVKIGEVSTGCLTGASDICCTRTSSLLAQQQCEWSTSCQATPTCPNNKPNLIGSTTSLGDGGPVCHGSSVRTLCCSNPNPYSNCAWNRGPFGGSACQGACSQNQTLVATSTEKCTFGSQVLCCDGTSESVDNIVFAVELASIDPNDVCKPNDTILYDGADVIPDQDLPGAEDLDSKRDVANIQKRQLGSAAFENDLLGSIPVWGNCDSFTCKSQAGMFDAILGPHFMSSLDFANAVNNASGADPTATVMYNFCGNQYALEDLQDFQQSNVETCVEPLPPDDDDESLEGNAVILEKRRFSAHWRSARTRVLPDPLINVRALMERIMTRPAQVPYLYSRILPFRGEANLEVAYDLRQAPDLQDRPGTDIFAVFHFHVPRLYRGLRDPVGDIPRIALPFYHAYHGQTVFHVNETNDWRVDYGRRLELRQGNGANLRTEILRCPATRTYNPGRTTGNTLAARFGNYLYTQGILHPSTLWNYQNNAWQFPPSPQGPNGRRPGEWPNTGRRGDPTTAADMRPNSAGGSQNWPEYQDPGVD